MERKDEWLEDGLYITALSHSHDVKTMALGVLGVVRLCQRVLCLYIYLLSFLYGAKICFDLLYIHFWMINLF